jgi:voltage-gated sodium channel
MDNDSGETHSSEHASAEANLESVNMVELISEPKKEIRRSQSHHGILEVGKAESESRWLSKIASVVSSSHFKHAMNCFILLNAIQLGLSVEFTGPRWSTAWYVCDNLFAIIFAVEMLMLLSVLGLNYFKDYWLLLDLVVVMLSILDAWVLPLLGNETDVGLFRQLRLLRLLRVVKITRVVPELSIVVEGLLRSMKSLFWVFVLLGVFLYAGGICCVEVLGTSDAGYPSYNDKQSNINDEFVDDFNNFVYFGSIYRSMITLFGIVLLAEWPLVRPVMELHTGMTMFFVLFVCLVAFGVLNVIIGIVVDKTLEAMQEIKDSAKEAAQVEMQQATENIAELLYQVDTDGDGRISSSELEASLKNPVMRKYLATLDLPHNFTVSDFLQMLDVEGTGDLSKTEFVEGIHRLIFQTDFQRNCLNQMAMGALHKSIHEVTSDLRTEIHKAIGEITREIQSNLKGSPEPAKHAHAQWHTDSVSNLRLGLQSENGIGEDCSAQYPTTTQLWPGLQSELTGLQSEGTVKKVELDLEKSGIAQWLEEADIKEIRLELPSEIREADYPQLPSESHIWPGPQSEPAQRPVAFEDRSLLQAERLPKSHNGLLHQVAPGQKESTQTI